MAETAAGADESERVAALELGGADGAVDGSTGTAGLCQVWLLLLTREKREAYASGAAASRDTPSGILFDSLASACCC